MPPGYQTRVAEIERLMKEIRAMDHIGRVLFESGPPLAEAANEIFVALKCESQLTPAPAEVTVHLDGKRRLLIHLSETEGVIEKKSVELAQVFQMLHELAGSDDRVVLLANNDRNTRPVDRPDPITPDAVAFLQRLGANFVSAPTLFKLWIVLQQDPKKARAYVDRLHAQDGGSFLLP
jgi:hypothetical protein